MGQALGRLPVVLEHDKGREQLLLNEQRLFTRTKKLRSQNSTNSRCEGLKPPWASEP